MRLVLIFSLLYSRCVIGLSPSLNRLSTQFHLENKLPISIEIMNDVQRKTNSQQVFLLLDVSVRNIKDLESLESIYSFIPRLVGRMKNAKQNIADDKFLYVHDIGEEKECRVAVSRIPLLMYQKLDLSKRLAEMIADREIIIHMISDEGQTIIDRNMADALISAVQSNIFTMPMFKNMADSATESSPKAAPFELHIVAPEKSFSSYQKSIEDPKIQQDEPVEMSPLEKAMLEASRRRIGEEAAPEELIMFKTQEITIDLDEISNSLNLLQYRNEGQNMARALSFLPPNILNPTNYADWIRDLATSHSWDYAEWYTEELREMGFGALVAVTNGNKPLTDRLVKLTYSGHSSKRVTISKVPPKTAGIGQFYSSSFEANTKESQRPIVLVGKGVCYDTGGVNVKSANSMKTMKHDMGGSAAALGLLYALHHANYPYPVECWVVLVENNINTDSYRPDDVVTSITGDTIEVVHTDAEGRMLLADTLAAASRKVPTSLVTDSSIPPKLLLDFATLTGTCITSLSNKYIGAFTNRQDYVSDIISAGEQCGERVWPFPADEDFDEDLKSDIADVLQCRQPTEADHIYAFSFLRRFVRANVPWVHLDLGSAYKPGGLGHIASDYTGSGVRVGFQLIQSLAKWDPYSST